jgi:hypothetical protein
MATKDRPIKGYTRSALNFVIPKVRTHPKLRRHSPGNARMQVRQFQDRAEGDGYGRRDAPSAYNLLIGLGFQRSTQSRFSITKRAAFTANVPKAPRL